MVIMALFFFWMRCILSLIVWSLKEWIPIFLNSYLSSVKPASILLVLLRFLGVLLNLFVSNLNMLCVVIILWVLFSVSVFIVLLILLLLMILLPVCLPGLLSFLCLVRMIFCVMILHRLLGGCVVMDLIAFELFSEVVRESVPYAITWIVGTWVVNTVITWVTGRGYGL